MAKAPPWGGGEGAAAAAGTRTLLKKLVKNKWYSRNFGSCRCATSILMVSCVGRATTMAFMWPSVAGRSWSFRCHWPLSISDRMRCPTAWPIFSARFWMFSLRALGSGRSGAGPLALVGSLRWWACASQREAKLA